MIILKIFIFIISVISFIGIVFLLRSFQLPARIRKAEDYFAHDNYPKASRIVKKILESRNDYVPAIFLRSKILFGQKQYFLAIAELNGLLKIDDFNRYVSGLEAHKMLAELYNETQQWQKEIEEYKAILALSPNNIAANNRIGHVLFKQKNFEAAQKYLSKALELDPSQADCFLPLGISWYSLFEYDAAEEYLLKVIEYSNTQFEACYYLGCIYQKRGEHEKAIGMFESSKKDNNLFILSLYRLGEIYFTELAYNKSIAILEKGLEKLVNNEDSLPYRYLLANCYELENNLNEAISHWEKIVDIKSDFRDAKTKIDEYKSIIENENLNYIFSSSMDMLQSLIAEIIARLNFNIISKIELSNNEYLYRAFNIKRINEPPALIYFHRTTRNITAGQISDFVRSVDEEKCKNSIYITTSNFESKAKNTAMLANIELIDLKALNKIIDKIRE